MLVEWLRKFARDIDEWTLQECGGKQVVLLRKAAAELSRLSAENADLRHDIERSMATCTELATLVKAQKEALEPNCRHMANAPLHGKGEAVVFVHVPEGCHCFPNDRHQWLCEQHLSKLDHAPYEILIDLRRARALSDTE
jgi:hypothetical protein